MDPPTAGPPRPVRAPERPRYRNSTTTNNDNNDNNDNSNNTINTNHTNNTKDTSSNDENIISNNIGDRLRVRPFQASGGIGTPQSRASGLRNPQWLVILVQACPNMLIFI